MIVKITAETSAKTIVYSLAVTLHTFLIN